MTKEVIRLRAIPLTPIHVGDGTELTPDVYKVEQKNERSALALFDPVRVLTDLGADERAEYVRRLNTGDLDLARRYVEERVTEAHVTNRMPLSDASARALAQRDGRAGRVHPFVRSDGEPFIPGSSIKGALRTALLDHFSKVDPSVAACVHEVPSVRGKHEALTRAAFGLRRDDTADDPLRFLSVGDVAIPPGSTRIDRAIVVKRGRGDALERNDMQMHYERLLAATDGNVPEARWLEVTITLDAAGMRDARRAACPPGRTFDAATLHDAAGDFSWGRWCAERKRFFAGEQDTISRMDRLLAGVRIAKTGKTLAEAGPREAPNYWLLRIGRFGHFESKSVDRLRQGYRPQDRQHSELEPGAEGLSRTVVETSFKATNGKEGRALVPFGWLLLFRQADR